MGHTGRACAWLGMGQCQVVLASSSVVAQLCRGMFTAVPIHQSHIPIICQRQCTVYALAARVDCASRGWLHHDVHFAVLARLRKQPGVSTSASALLQFLNSYVMVRLGRYHLMPQVARQDSFLVHCGSPCLAPHHQVPCVAAGYALLHGVL